MSDNHYTRLVTLFAILKNLLVKQMLSLSPYL